LSPRKITTEKFAKVKTLALISIRHNPLNGYLSILLYGIPNEIHYHLISARYEGTIARERGKKRESRVSKSKGNPLQRAKGGRGDYYLWPHVQRGHFFWGCIFITAS